MANSKPVRSRVENALAYTFAALLGLSVLSIIAIMVMTVFFPRTPQIPLLVVFPWLALPASALLIIVLLFMQIRRKNSDS
jgi:amino acid transporter